MGYRLQLMSVEVIGAVHAKLRRLEERRQNLSIEKILFAAADKMRGAMDAGEYKHIALGLLFLRYVSEAFARRRDLIVADGGDPEDRDEYLAENTFFVPEPARWSTISARSKASDIGITIDDAMRRIEAENPSLKGALPKVFGKESIDRAMLTGLIDLFSNLELDGTKNDFDAGANSTPRHPWSTR